MAAVAARYPGFGDPQAGADLPHLLDAANSVLAAVETSLSAPSTAAQGI